MKNNSTLLSITKVTITAATLIYCYTLIEIDGIFNILQQVNTATFTLALALNFLGTIICKSILVWKILPTTNNTSLLHIIIMNLGLRFYTIFLPRAVVAGIRWYKYKKLSDSTSSLVVLSFESILTLSMLTYGALLFFYISDIKGLSISIVAIMIIASVICTAALLFATHTKSTYIIENCLLFISKKSRFSRPLKKVFSRLRSLNLSTSENIKFAFISSAASYTLFILSAYFVAQALNIPLGIIDVAWSRSLILLIAHIPISIAGLGIRELGFVTFLSYIGIDANTAIAYALLSFSLQVSLAIIGAHIEAYKWLKKDA